MAKTLPKAPQHEGVDPLTKSPTYHSPENVKEASEEGAAERQKEAAKKTQETSAKSAQTLSDQEAVEKNAGTDNDTLTEGATSDSSKTTTSSKSKK